MSSGPYGPIIIGVKTEAHGQQTRHEGLTKLLCHKICLKNLEANSNVLMELFRWRNFVFG